MKRQLLMIIGLIVASAAMARVIPGDGEKQWRWVIDAAMPEDNGAGEPVDLSNAPVVRAYETLYRVYGDTLVCRSVPGMREWLVLRDGSLWRVGANDRVTRHAHSRGVMYLPSDLAPAACSCSDTLTVSALDSDPETVAVNSMLSVTAGPGFILACGDTIPRTVEVSELCVSTGAGGVSVTTTSRRWYADGCLIPVVEETGMMSGGELHSILTVCPPSEQPHDEMTQSRGDGMFGAPQLPHDTADGCLEIVRQGDVITAGNAGGEGDTVISVCDVQGRLMRAGSGSVPTGGLPPGWYIITAAGSSGNTSVKFRID